MTMKLGRAVAAAAILAASFAANAESFEFDTITAYQTGSVSVIAGVLRNSATPVTVAFTFHGGTTNGCIPAILTMMEKPGRYYLSVDLSDNEPLPKPVRNCALTLRT